jgi:hypothetical protein
MQVVMKLVPPLLEIVRREMDEDNSRIAQDD